MAQEVYRISQLGFAELVKHLNSKESVAFALLKVCLQVGFGSSFYVHFTGQIACDCIQLFVIFLLLNVTQVVHI